MLTVLWSWLAGYVVLHLSGGGQERFLNLVLQREIAVWDVNWLADDVLEMKADWQQLKSLRKIAAITGCQMALRRRQGLPFALRYLRGRKTLAVGMLLFALGLFALSQLVFAVQVLPQETLHRLDTAQVQRVAADLGIKPGAVYRQLDIDEISRRIKAQIPEVSWVYIERSGTVVHIKVAERSIYPDELENATRGAIWANRDALVEEVLIKHGQAVAAHGDTVQKGDLLVSPLADGKADAIVRARVWYRGYGEGALQEEVVTPQGKPTCRYYLQKPDGAVLNLWGDEPDVAGLAADEQILSETTPYMLNIGGMQLVLQRQVLQHRLVSQRQISEAEAKAAAYEQAKATIAAQQNPNSTLLNEEADYQLLEGGVWAVNLMWECREEIGVHYQNQPADTDLNCDLNQDINAAE
ncbi:MAG: sporulation protein YqfD [Firmicutes bacterium]|nr:sporulation protein YqfD [Bacillota bacterium]